MGLKRVVRGTISSIVRQPKRELPVGVRRGIQHVRTATRIPKHLRKGKSKKAVGAVLVRAGRKLGG